MPTLQATSPSAPTGPRSRTRSRRRARTCCATSCLLRNLEVKQLKQTQELQRARAHAAARPKHGDHALLAPDGRVRAHRYPDHRRARGHRGRIGQQALQADARRASASRSTTVCRSPTRSPSTRRVFPPYYIGILRSSELTGQLDIVARAALAATSNATSTRAGKIKAALVYPVVISACRSLTVVDPRGVGAAEVREVLQEPRSAKLPLPTRMLHRDLATPRRSSGSSGSALFIAGSSSVLLVDAQVGQGPAWSATACSSASRWSRTSCCSRSSSACAASSARWSKAGVPLPDTLAAAIQGANNKVFEAASRDRAGADARGRGSRANRSPTRICSRRPRRR